MIDKKPRRFGAIHGPLSGFFALAAMILTALLPMSASAAFEAFESGQVRPLAMSPSGNRLFVVNTPDNRLEIFDITNGGLQATESVSVGLEPVAVAARNNDEIWVVNLLSDSISVVDVKSKPARVIKTLLVGDEPRDIVFAGPARGRAFITTAHRGQNSSANADLIRPGVGRADVWVFDAANTGTALGGTPIRVVNLFTDTPRALAVSSNGATVYAAGFNTGNGTTSLNEGSVCDGGANAPPCRPEDGLTAAGGLPGPNQNIEGRAQPETGLIVKLRSGNWLDELNRSWNNQVRFSLPDNDVFEIDASASLPLVRRSFSGVGTSLFNIAVNPKSGKLYVSNTEALNEVRFEGERPPGDNTSTVQGRLHQARITVIDNGLVQPRHLNKHINYAVNPAPAGTAANSLATPTGMAVTKDGKTLYLAAFGSGKVGIFNTSTLENDSFTPSSANHIAVGGGPTGLVLDEDRKRLYVLSRFDNSVVVVDTKKRTQTSRLALHNPEPASLVNGRRFLYDATLTSSNGEASCSSCHVFGDLDSLAWDLGNPRGQVEQNIVPFTVGPVGDPDWHPMKGPMTTQSLRGMDNHGPMHWRGDRPGVQTDRGNFSETEAFKQFNGAFVSLLGRAAPLSEADMQAFADFTLQLRYPPNPVRALDNSLTADQAEGRRIYLEEDIDTGSGGRTCNSCHVLDPANGYFGTDGRAAFVGEAQHMKIPQLRNIYTKVGMFGNPETAMIRVGQNENTGDQIRGYGLIHDGSVDTVFRFLATHIFDFTIIGGGGTPEERSARGRRQVEQFVLAYASNFSPIVGQQITLSTANSATNSRIDLMIARAQVGECDLVVKGVVNGVARGFVRTISGNFRTDRASEAPMSAADLRSTAAIAGQALTYTCVPRGSGIRIGIDRDEDGVLDGDES